MVISATMDKKVERQPLLAPYEDRPDEKSILIDKDENGRIISGSGKGETRSKGSKEARNNWLILLLMVLVIASGSANSVARKISTQAMGNYSLFLTLFSATAYCIMYHGLLFIKVMLGLVQRWNYAYPWIREEYYTLSKQNFFQRVWHYLPPFKYFVIIGFLESWGNVLQIVATTYLSGPMVSLLGQTTIFYSMIVSWIMFKTKFSLIQVFGVFLVVGGAMVPLVHELMDASPTGHKVPLAYYIIMTVSSFPMTISFSIKEMIFQKKKGVDIFVVNGTSSLFQLVWWPSVVPITELLHQTGGTPLLTYFKNALTCFIGQDPNHTFDFECNSNPVPYCVYITINILYNIAVILLIKKASAVQSFMALNGVLPCSVILFCINWPLIGATHIDIYVIISLVVVMAGLVFYRWATIRTEKKRRLKSEHLSVN